MKKRMIALLLAWLTVFSVSYGVAGTITVADPWIREAPPGVAMLAAYMTITNDYNKEVELQRASSLDFRKIEMHWSKMQEGMSHMVKHSALQIGPNESIILKPGGRHLMLMGPQRQFKAGDTVRLQLKFDNGEVISVQAVVRRQ